MNSEWVVRIGVVAVGLAVYFGLVIAIHLVTDYFFGWVAADRVTKFIGFPIRLVFWICNQLKRVVTWPWRYRNRRLLLELFRVEVATALTQADRKRKEAQREVDRELIYRARGLRRAFDRQEAARKHPLNKTNLEAANDDVKRAKKEFWFAHGVAKRGGYRVRKRYSDYL